MQHDRGDVHTPGTQLRYCLVCERTAGGWHFGTSRHAGEYGLIIAQWPAACHVFVPYGTSVTLGIQQRVHAARQFRRPQPDFATKFRTAADEWSDENRLHTAG